MFGYELVFIFYLSVIIYLNAQSINNINVLEERAVFTASGESVVNKLNWENIKTLRVSFILGAQ